MIAWSSMLTQEMVSNLSDNDLSLLINSLDEAVQEICESFEVA